MNTVRATSTDVVGNRAANERDLVAWLPVPAAELEGAPAGIDYLLWDGGEDYPGDPAAVDFYAPPLTADVGVILRPLALMKRLRVIQALSAGVDHLIPRLGPGVTLCNARDVHTASTAELALTLILSALRGLPDFVRSQSEQHWRPGLRPTLAGLTVLIVGYGSVGAAIEELLVPFGCQVVRVARTERGSSRGLVHAPSALSDLLPKADVVVLTVPLTDETRGLVGTEFLTAMKDGALLVNVARGPVVNTDALITELTTGRIRAALDVTDPEPLPAGHPLWTAPGALITPHAGAFTSALLPGVKKLLTEQLDRFARGARLQNVVAEGNVSSS